MKPKKNTPMKQKRDTLRATVLSEFFGNINEKTEERIIFTKVDTGEILACLVCDELRNEAIENGDIVVIKFIEMETPIIWTTRSFCILEIINNYY